MSKRYTLLIIPRGRGEPKKWEVSFLTVATLFMLFIAGVAGLASLSIDGIFYRKAYLDSEFLAKNVTPKADNTKMIELENTVKRLERLAFKLTSSSLQTSKTPAIGGLAKREIETPQADKKEDVDFIESFNRNVWKSPFPKNESNEMANLNPEDLMKEAEGTEEQLMSIAFTLEKGAFFLSAVPTAWPLRGWLTSGFADIRGNRIHEGIDIASPVGTPIFAPSNGIVTYVGYKKGYGKILKINHGFGLETVYAHCSRVDVKEGQGLEKGTRIALVGNTGNSTGPHLHYEIRLDGLPVNPLRYIADSL